MEQNPRIEPKKSLIKKKKMKKKLPEKFQYEPLDIFSQKHKFSIVGTEN